MVVIVNPGKLMNVHELLKLEDHDAVNKEEDEVKMDVPFILFLDSLRAHNKKSLKKHLYGWLNFEAKRLDKFPKLQKDMIPFNNITMPLCAPKGKLLHELLNFSLW